MSRHYGDWLQAFMDYASIGEAPPHVYFWTGVSAVAGALRRRAWINMGHFKWYPNFYVVIVAPPGIVSKSTTASIGMQLLREVPGVHFGPSVITWQALITALGEVSEMTPIGDDFHPMSALTIESSEFGNLLNPQDREMIDMYVNLWDSPEGVLEKKTKHSGSDSVVNPWLNLIACTTPSWIAGNFPEYMIGGGFTSRCIFVYAERKENLRAYPRRSMPRSDTEQAEMKSKLIADLTDIASGIGGEYILTEEAFQWGEAWYEQHYAAKPANLSDDRFAGYLARKQTHLHKLAMILAASGGQGLQITANHLETALAMLTDLEPDMQKVFEKIGKTDQTVQIERMVEFIRVNGESSYSDAYRSVHSYFPNHRVFEEMLSGCVRSGLLTVKTSGPGITISLGPSAGQSFAQAEGA